MIRIGHPRGLCNRLDVITTGLLLAAERGESEIEVHWPVNEDLPVHFNELFEPVPGVQVVEREVEPAALRTAEEAHLRLPRNFREVTRYGSLLRRVIECVVPEVMEPVRGFEAQHGLSARDGRGRVGVHVRRREQWVSISPFAQPSLYYEAVMTSFPRDTRFFISTDSQEAFAWFRRRFGARVCQREKQADNRCSLAGVREGLVDMLLLSRCEAVIGTHNSSFSALSAYAGGRPLLMVNTRPYAVGRWSHFSPARWAWAHRHFVLEPTFWRVLWHHRTPGPRVVAAVGRRLRWPRRTGTTAHPA